MESLHSTFLLFVAAIAALLTYLIVPRVPAAMLGMIAAVGLAIGVWWHWTQFAVEYRTSTWQEQLQYYASYVMVLVVLLASYAFYAFTWGGASIQETTVGIRNAGRKTTTSLLQSAARTLNTASNTIFRPAAPAAVAPVAEESIEMTPNTSGFGMLE